MFTALDFYIYSTITDYKIYHSIKATEYEIEFD